MKARAWFLSTHAVALLLCVSVACAQTTELGPAPPTPAQPEPAQPQPAQPVFTQQELDQMLAPIALYPDSLLSQILMASTYPIEIVQAARWSKANPNLKGDDAVRAVEQNNWDPSVQSLVAFPQVISMMDEKLDWMERLGDAFLSQQQQVMDTVQGLRQKAQAAGNLQSNENVRVEPQGQTIAIEQANPQVVYVPYYNPTVVYGPWWWADYPPVYWGPWPGYYARPGFGAGFFWGAGITIGAGFFFGAFDWPHRHVSVVNVNNFYYRPGPRVGNGPGWQHDPGHRRGVPYRDPALRQETGRPGGRSDARREFRGNEPSRVQNPGTPGSRPDARNVAANRPEQRDRTQPGAGGNARPNAPDAGRPEPSGVPRPDAATAPSRPNEPNVGRPGPRSVPTPPAASAAPSRPSVESRPHIFEGVGQGATVRDSSARGRSSSEQMAPVRPAARPQGTAPAPRQGGNASPQRLSGGGRSNGGQQQQHQQQR
jgi:Protein of unknown function (DUF3300)